MSKKGNNADSSYCISTVGTLRNSVGQVATLVVSENALVRAGITHILSDTCFTVMDAPAAVPALCLIDANGSSVRVLEAVTRVKSQYPLCKVALIESYGELEFVQAAISAGVDGFCSATGIREVLIKSLELVMLGEKLLPKALIQALLSQALEINSPIHATVGASPPDPRVQKLSPREKTILHSIMGGDANKVIARKLEVTEATVKVHVKAILRKVGASNRTQAAMWAAGHLMDVHQSSMADVKEAPRPN
jgi:two-component system nitrate/nitrite response regulator NarL